MVRLIRRLEARDSADDPISALCAAVLALLAGEGERAEELIGRVVRADSGAIHAYLALGSLYRSSGKVERAMRIHQRLLLRDDLDDGERVDVLMASAADFEPAGLLRRCVACYEEVLSYDARNAEALGALVGLLSQEGDYARAIAMNRRLSRAKREKNPTAEARLLVGMAEAAHAQGQDALARRAVKRALRRDAGSCRALTLLGQLESERGRHKAALAAWRKAAQIGGSDAAPVYPRLETAFLSLDRGSEYPQLLRRLLETRRDDTVLRLALARALAERGDAEAAVVELRRLLDGDSRNIQARVALGRLLLSEHRDTDALKEYNELLEALERWGDPREMEEPA